MKYELNFKTDEDSQAPSTYACLDNQLFPPSISGIQNGIVAYAMNQREWSTGVERAKIKVELHHICIGKFLDLSFYCKGIVSKTIYE